MSGVLSSVPSTIPGISGGLSAPGYSSGSGTVQITSGTSNITVPQTSGLGLSSLLGVAVDVLAILILLALVGIFVIIVVANRADPDPTGRRPQSVYYFAISFVTIIISIIGSAVVVWAILRLFGSHAGSITNSTARTVVIGGLITAVSLFVLTVHLRRGVALARADDQVSSPSRRVGQSYVSATAFLSVLVLLIVTVVSIYLLFALAGPGVFGSFGGRGPTGRDLAFAVYLGVVAVLVLGTHRNLVPPGLQILGRRDALHAVAAAPPDPQQ